MDEAMRPILRKLARFAKNPNLQMFVAIVLIVTSLQETWGSVAEDFSQLKFRVFHGTLLLGIVHLLRILPEFVEGIERASKATGSEDL
jgi:hypothetical protein